jgi:hypothetical protein
MITGKSLQDVAASVRAEAERAEDYIVPSPRLRMATTEGKYFFAATSDTPSIEPTDRFHGQMSAHLNIPKKYYDRMRKEAPGLLVNNVNNWMERGDSKRLIRTFKADEMGHSEGRAFLSDRYRRLDNYDLMAKLLPVAQESGLHVRSAELTDRRLYLQMVTQKIAGEVKKGDALYAGVVVSNSEVGAGSLNIQRMIYRLVCTNGMISGRDDGNFRRAHIGRTMDSENLHFSDETIQATDKAFWMQASDALKSALDADLFNEELDGLRELAGIEIGDPVETIDRLTNRFELADSESDNVMRHLIEGNDLSQWGVVNAITRSAEDVDSYDRAIELEVIGGKYADKPEAVS